ncbi:MAG TPA: ArsR family transcriptional regulator, partial [Actinotalea sp.]|nr:ArsR family transcriptional regulator [Actinotalea sp.]
ATGEVAAGEIASIGQVTQPTVSHHLRVLRQAGVLTAERRGTRVYYRVVPALARALPVLLESLRDAPGAPRPDDDAPAPEVRPTPAGVADRLRSQLGARFPLLTPEQVLGTVRETYADLARTSWDPRALPGLAERFAVQRLEDLERVAGRRPGAPARPQVLFVCTANAGRSQLAAALLQRHAGDAVVVRSAGSMPAPAVHDVVRPLLAEILGDDAPPPFPKPLTDDAVRAADVVVTMGCGDTCPVLPGVRYEDWAVGDPALASPAGARSIRDDIDRRVRSLAAELLAPSRPTRARRPTPDPEEPR